MLLRFNIIWPLLAGFLLSSGLGAKPPASRPPADTAFAEGTVFSSRAIVIDGWIAQGHEDASRTFTKRVSRGKEVIETQECCIAVFMTDKAALLLQTEVVTSDSQGNALTERVIRRKRINLLPGEGSYYCSLLWIEPQLVLRNSRTGGMRTVIYQDGEVIILPWRFKEGDPGVSCYPYPED